jgi:tyrosyl-tRNA synthetase
MGKSLGNYVGVGEPADEQFGKTMSIPDHLMPEWFTLLTDRPADDIARLTDAAATHPMEAKKRLASDVVTFYYGADAAAAARKEWEHRFSERQDPTEVPEVEVLATALENGQLTITKLLVAVGLAKSNNQARQFIQQGSVTIGPHRERITDPNISVAVTSGLIVRVGSRRVVRVKLSSASWKG